MSDKLSFSKRNITFIVSSLIILISVLFYLFILVPQNKERFNEQRLRYFNRFGKNLGNSIDACVKAVRKGNMVEIEEIKTDSLSKDSLGSVYIKNKNLVFQFREKRINVCIDSLLKPDYELFEQYTITFQALKNYKPVGSSSTLPEVIYSDNLQIAMDSLRKFGKKGNSIFEYGDDENKKFILSSSYIVKPQNIEEELEFNIYGIVSESKYKKELLDLDTKHVIYFVITILILLLTVPLLKSAFLGKHESLSIFDVIKTSVSFFMILQILVTTTLIILMFEFIEPLNTEKKLKDYNLKARSAICSRVDSLVARMRNVDNCFMKDTVVEYVRDSLNGVVKFDKNNKFNSQQLERLFDYEREKEGALKKDLTFFNTKETETIFWLSCSKNDFGKEIEKISFTKLSGEVG
ncbi:MAG: hypothetical protein IAF38_05160, partial [Bacteroidia bacterium]|nr:hypothetical protein [Bacteroidia bacterium]